MNYHTRKRLESRLAREEARRDKLDASYSSLLDEKKQSATMDTGNGRVSFTNRNLEDVGRELDKLENSISLLYRKIHGGATVAFNVRRYV